MKKRNGKGNGAGKRKRHALDVKRRAVKLYVEDGFPAEVVAEELGVGHSTLSAWAKRYREQGEAALQPAGHPGRAQVSEAAKRKAVELKRQNPAFGAKRISQLLRRLFFLKAGPETVRRTLKEEPRIAPPPPRPKRNPGKPRFFERATPNQMWQADIFSFRLGGRSAYLIGYVDDYSRYVTGLDLFRSQTAEHVLEVYRQAVGEYGVPKEMLTDNGRQYTNWRGKTRFEQELAKERIRHIRSQPHHPMTLGKIERLWKTIWGEFLCRAQFDSFEEARERVRLWVKYYNHKRPHQGIGGLCPADRFFEIQHQLRKVLDQGVADNVLEQALRGKPQAPFYLVGRMGEQSVVIRAEKGKVRMLVDGEVAEPAKELVYKVEGDHGSEERSGGQEAGPQGVGAVRSEDEVRGGAGGVVGTAQAGGGVPGVGDQLGGVERVAEPGDGRNAAGALAEGRGEAVGVVAAAGAASGAETGHAGDECAPAAAAAEGAGTSQSAAGVTEGVNDAELSDEHRAAAGTGPAAGGDDPQGAGRAAQRVGGGAGVGDQPQDVLQVGEAGLGGVAGGALRAELGPAGFSKRWGAGGLEEEEGDAGAGAPTPGAAAGDPDAVEG